MTATSKTPIEFKSKAARLKYQLRAVKPTLILIGFKNMANIIVKHYPEYESVNGMDDMRKVYEFRQSDSKLTDIMIAVANGELK